MSTRIFFGGLIFILLFLVIGYVLLNEGLLDVQAQDSSGRMQVYKASQDGLSIETGAALFGQYCTSCHGDKGEGVAGKGPQLNPYLFTTRFPELRAANYPNSLSNFIKLTIAAGRPDYSTYWSDKGETYAAPMQTWSQFFGGPLRDDQVENMTSYIMSWEAAAGQAAVVTFEKIGNDLAKALPAGDAARGQRLWNKEETFASQKPAPCSACHSLQPGQTLVGPSLAGIDSRAGSTVAGQDATTYIRHSIQAPSEYLVPGGSFASGGKSLMPANLGNDMSAQDLADLIAYLSTLK
jgi:mono/diheme cytochrome c family protein